MTPTGQKELRETFTPMHHKIAECLGYKQTPTYASWDKVEQTAPVQEVERLVSLFEAELQKAVLGVLNQIVKGKYRMADNFSERFVSLEDLNAKIAELRHQWEKGE